MGKGLCCGDAEERERERDFPRPTVRLRWNRRRTRGVADFLPSPSFLFINVCQKVDGIGLERKRGEREGKKLLQFPPVFLLSGSVRPGAKKSSLPSPFLLFHFFFFAPQVSSPLSWPISKKGKSQIPPQGGIISSTSSSACFQQVGNGLGESRIPRSGTRKTFVSVNPKGWDEKRDSRAAEEKKKKLQRTFSSEKTTMLEAKHVW